MTHIHREALLPFSDQQMFTLVNEVADYPAYMEGCASVEIIEKSDKTMIAALALEKRGIKLTFTTRNTLDEPKSIVMVLEDGPFECFEGRWFFQRLDDQACKVILDLQFSLSSRLGSLAVKRLFDSVANNMVDAMVKRARVVYGR